MLVASLVLLSAVGGCGCEPIRLSDHAVFRFESPIPAGTYTVELCSDDRCFEIPELATGGVGDLVQETREGEVSLDVDGIVVGQVFDFFTSREPVLTVVVTDADGTAVVDWSGPVEMEDEPRCTSQFRVTVDVPAVP